MKTKLLPPILLPGVFLFAACVPIASPAPTPDVALIQTSAAQTVIVNLTRTASVSTFPPLPPPTDTPTPGLLDTPTTTTPTLEATSTPTLSGGITATPILCDALSFDPATVDVNIPDNTEMQPGQTFVKTWRVKNNGSCTWGAGYRLVFSYGDRMSGQPLPLSGVVGPGQEVEVSVQFKAPTKAGAYLSAWQMANALGRPFPKPIYVKIVVR